MGNEAFIDRFMRSLDSLRGVLSIGCLDLIVKEDGGYVSKSKKLFDESFPTVAFARMIDTGVLETAKSSPVFDLKLSGPGGDVFCSLFPLSGEGGDGYIVIQGDSQLDQVGKAVGAFMAGLLAGQPDDSKGRPDTAGGKYRDGLLGMREIQAKLFPRFAGVDGLDIASVYLPVELMSGDFIDAFYLDENLYQITGCDVTGYDAASSYAGAAMRTLIKSLSSKKIVPSALIELTVSKLDRILEELHSLVYMTIFQIEPKTGKARLSSLGRLNTILYKAQKKGFIVLNKTSIGYDLAKRNVFKDISFVIEPGDILLFYSNGVSEVASENGKMAYGESRIVECLNENLGETSMDIVHALTESLSGFANHSGFDYDVLIISIKKT
ncbi:MAG TPA: SpoIIE family protein phosphatase [Spirochaetota bacterium]|nr:SpoIIE family protein phosphatase [Spirochaetota bacterium]